MTNPVNSHFTTDHCMLHRPAPQITSRPVTSVTAVGLPSHCTSKLTNPSLTDCCTNQTVCVCPNGCDSNYRGISFRMNVVYFTDRAKCTTVLTFTHPKKIGGEFCCHTKCGRLVERDCCTYCSLQCGSFV